MNTTEYYITRLLIIFGFLIFGFFASKIVGNFYYSSLVNQPNPALEKVENYYKERIKNSADAPSAATLGMAFLRTGNYDLALIAFGKATELEPEWRDGWIWKGYTELKVNQSENALVSLKKAEKIDPLHPLTYRLLVTAYQKTGDKALAQKAQEKLTLLSSR